MREIMSKLSFRGLLSRKSSKQNLQQQQEAIQQTRPRSKSVDKKPVVLSLSIDELLQEVSNKENFQIRGTEATQGERPNRYIPRSPSAHELGKTPKSVFAHNSKDLGDRAVKKLRFEDEVVAPTTIQVPAWLQDMHRNYCVSGERNEERAVLEGILKASLQEKDIESLREVLDSCLPFLVMNPSLVVFWDAPKEHSKNKLVESLFDFQKSYVEQYKNTLHQIIADQTNDNPLNIDSSEAISKLFEVQTKLNQAYTNALPCMYPDIASRVLHKQQVAKNTIHIQ